MAMNIIHNATYIIQYKLYTELNMCMYVGMYI